MKGVRYPKLGQSIKAEVVVIGGGITGILTAYLLAKDGRDVVLIEKDKIGQGSTQYTTAFITELIDTTFSELIDLLGIEKAKLVIGSHEEAINFLEKITRDEKITCNFTRCSNYFYANSDKELESLKEEYEAGKKLSLDLEFHPHKNDLHFKNAGYIELKNQAKFNASLVIDQLARAVVKNGGKIFEQTAAESIDSHHEKPTVAFSHGTIEADWVVVATYEPFNKPLGLYFKKAFYTSYVLQAELPKGILGQGIYEDTEDPYHYFRIDRKENADTIVIGGEDHRSDIHVDPAKNFAALQEYLKSILPDVSYKITKKWTGPILEPVDGLAFIGPYHANNVLYALGFSGNGMTYSSISAMIFRDYISGEKNPWLSVYHADRLPTLKSLVTKGKDYTRELIHGALKNSLRK
jgi:glycine/D-amino acid oxidase-like deaminating enzyme